MNVSLTAELEEYISVQLQSGHYRSASELVREALRNHIRRSMQEKIDFRIEASRQQVKEGQIILADDDYFEKKREIIREKYLQGKTSS